MAKHRSAFQLLQDAQRKIAKLKERVAREVVSDHKEIRAFDSRIKSVQTELTKVRRWTNEDNGLSARIEKLKAQISECETKLANASLTQSELEMEIATLKDERMAKATEILAQQDVDVDSLIEAELNGQVYP